MLRFLIVLFSALGLLAQAPPKALATDAQIEAQLHDRLAKSVIGKDGFIAKVKGGVVTWEGSTAIGQHKGAATRMAKSSGARRVVNNIKVKKAGAGPVPAKVKPAVQSAPPPPPSEPPPPPLRRLTVRWR
jgi:PPE-repeat protein